MPRGSVAQLVERTTENREVTGSTPVGATAEAPAQRGLRHWCGGPEPQDTPSRRDGADASGSPDEAAERRGVLVRPERGPARLQVQAVGERFEHDGVEAEVIDEARDQLDIARLVARDRARAS